MVIESHLAELARKHCALEKIIEDCQRNPGFDSLEIRDLKKKKLRVKEQIERLKGQIQVNGRIANGAV